MRLMLLNGSGAPAEIALPRDRSTMVTHGTLDGTDEQGMRALHAWIQDRNGTVSLRTGRSPRGTFLNGERISGWHPLRAGDVIGFGDAEYRAVGVEAHDDLRTAVSSGRQDDALAASEAAYRQGDREHALQILATELEHRPDNAPARLAHGILEWETGRVDGAARTLYGYLQAEPDSVKALAYYGLVLKHQARFAEAVTVLQRAHALAPSSDLEQEISACQAAAHAAGSPECHGGLRVPPQRSEGPSRRVPPRAPRPPKWTGSLVGIARDVTVDVNIRRSELRFTLIAANDPDRRVPVLMKCGRIVGGVLGNGHWVELPPNAKTDGGGYKVKRLRNLSTGQELSGGPSPVVNAGLRRQFGMPRGFRF